MYNWKNRMQTGKNIKSTTGFRVNRKIRRSEKRIRIPMNIWESFKLFQSGMIGRVENVWKTADQCAKSNKRRKRAERNQLYSSTSF